MVSVVIITGSISMMITRVAVGNSAVVVVIVDVHTWRPPVGVRQILIMGHVGGVRKAISIATRSSSVRCWWKGLLRGFVIASIQFMRVHESRDIIGSGGEGIGFEVRMVNRIHGINPCTPVKSQQGLEQRHGLWVEL
jgi:hypothetical protein